MQWEAKYHDGTVHTEAELDTSEQIDRSQLKEFRLYKDDKAVFIAMFEPDDERKLVFRRRVTKRMDDSPDIVVYLVGWHQNIGGKSIKSICYVYEDGHIEFDTDRNNLELVPAEL